MTAKEVRKFLGALHVDTLFSEPGSLWANGYIESFNGKLPDELLNGKVFLHRAGDKGLAGAVAAALQSCSAAHLAGLPSAGPRVHQAAPVRASSRAMEVVQVLGAGQGIARV